MKSRVPERLGGAFVALVAASAALLALRSIAAWQGPGPRLLLELPALPREGLGIAWSSRAVWPVELQALALERTGAILVALLFGAASVALLNTLVLLAEGGAARWSEVAVRASLGATPGELVCLLVTRVRTAAAAAVALGGLLGVASGGALRATWPGPVADAPGMAALPGAAAGLAALAGGVLLAYAGVALRTGRGGALAATVASGGRATATPAAVFFRWVLSATQTGVAGAVLLGSGALALALIPAPRDDGAGADGVAVLDVTAPGPAAEWDRVLARIGHIPGMAAGSLATPGALAGLGVRDYATAQCGRCFRGGLPLPLWGAEVDHHAVTPGYFAAVGRRIVEGRGITSADVAGSERVLVVNETFARSSFERGRPVGRKVRLGRDVDAWYTVVGVVADEAVTALGGDDLPRAAAWVSAFQQPPRTAHLLLV